MLRWFRGAAAHILILEGFPMAIIPKNEKETLSTGSTLLASINLGACAALPLKDDGDAGFYDADPMGFDGKQSFSGKKPAARSYGLGTESTGTSSSTPPGTRRARQEFDPLRQLPSTTEGVGVAFDSTKALATLTGECRAKAGGACLHNVADALAAGGLDVRCNLPNRGGSHWAKDLASVLQRDGRFNEVGTGHGARLEAGYEPKIGDVAVWTGGRFGHTQMFAGYDKAGHQVWMSDFKTNPHNWTGLRDAASHGDVHIYRQKSEPMLASAQPHNSTAPATTKAATGRTHAASAVAGIS